MSNQTLLLYEVAKLYLTNRTKHDTTVREWTKKYAQ